MESKTCGTCRFWESSLNECHIKPPTVVEVVTVWPKTFSHTKACWEWKVIE